MSSHETRMIVFHDCFLVNNNTSVQFSINNVLHLQKYKKKEQNERKMLYN